VTVLHADIDAPMEIGDNVLIGHGVVLHGLEIGNNTLIGNNATLLDKSKIGSSCIVAAGSLVSPGREIPDNSLVAGVPAKIKGQVKGQVSQKQRAQIQEWLQVYAELMKRYKEQGL